MLAPNHHETAPWRFWVVGRETLDALAEATGDRKLLRSQTAIVVGVERDPDAQIAEEDYAAVACAIENFMLAARGRGLASFWRTPGVLSLPVVAKLLNVSESVRLIGVVHVGWPGEPFPPRARAQCGAVHDLAGLSKLRASTRGQTPAALTSDAPA